MKESCVGHIDNNIKRRVGNRNRNASIKKNSKVANSKIRMKVKKVIEGIWVQSTYKPMSTYIQIRYTSNPVSVGKQCMVCTGCTLCKKCTQVVSNRRETSDEGLKLYSIVRLLIKEKTMMAIKRWLCKGYVPQLVKRRFCVARYSRPKSIEKGRSATAQGKMRKCVVVNTLIEHGKEANARIKGRSFVVHECTVKKVNVSTYIKVCNIAAVKMNQTGKGEREGTMDVDGLLAGGSQGKKNVTNSERDLIMSIYDANIVTKCAVPLVLEFLVILPIICYMCALSKYRKCCPFNVKSRRVVTITVYIWTVCIMHADIVSGNRLYKTVAQAFIEWGGRYGE